MEARTSDSKDTVKMGVEEVDVEVEEEEEEREEGEKEEAAS